MARVFTLDRPIPHVLTKEELADLIGLSVRQVDHYRRLKNHPAVKELPGPGQPRFDGRAVEQWRDGGKRERQFFSKAR
jgi:hypothetical protein